MLQQAPATGDELRQRIASSIGDLWLESFGQLYPALHALREEELIDEVGAARASRETRRYAIANGDAGTFAPITSDGVRLTLHRGGGASTLELPVDPAP